MRQTFIAATELLSNILFSLMNIASPASIDFTRTMMTTNGIAAHASDETRPLKVLIVGAGIGGLTAAIALRNQGHDIQIFEQSHLATETGAAIHLAPNANGLLRRLGVFAEQFGANPMERVKPSLTSGTPWTRR